MRRVLQDHSTLAWQLCGVLVIQWSYWDDYDNRYHSSPNYLVLEMNVDQIAVSPLQTSVRVEVDQYVYNRLKESSSTRIYYSPESPLTFLLEDEL